LLIVELIGSQPLTNIATRIHDVLDVVFVVDSYAFPLTARSVLKLSRVFLGKGDHP
jgi:hypothetical protein